PIDELAALCFLSRSRFQHLFGEVMGLSPIRYRNHLRANHGLNRLATSSDTVQVIALECGFQSVAQFAQSVRKATGMSPSRYRESAN
ncbi:MAG: helix-turn-helix domain-containing protein, partial [Chitinivibrionales bacterium]|nr:helix-turn-helix domain-containing protein [Chitinivibrionales bacterium]MBD3355891.1 helix-turn-helix domain-containing protein [Chitinivibrionales bacterium]